MPHSSEISNAYDDTEAATRLRELLVEALEAADEGLSPEVGARLQELIDLTDQLYGTRAAA